MAFTSTEKRPLLVDTPTLVTHVQPSRLWRNAFVLNFSVLLRFSGISAINAIQSSLNSDQGLGVTYLAVRSAFICLGSLLSGVVIRLLGCKWSLIIANLISGLSILCNFYPMWGTFIPAAIIFGLGSGLSLVAQRVYTAQLAHLHSDATRTFVKDGNRNIADEHNQARSRTQGHFFLFLMASTKLAYVTGNLASSLILGTGSGDLPSTDNNYTSLVLLGANQSTEAMPQCGSNYCNENLHSDFYDVSDEERSNVYALIGFSVGTFLLSVAVMFFFLDDQKKLSLMQSTVGVSSPLPSLTSLWGTLKSTVAMHKNPRLLLLVPSLIFLMALDNFWIADFSKAFITCTLGMEFIGYVMLWMGVAGATASVSFGWMSSSLLRRGPLVFAPVLQIGLAVGLLYWTPGGNSLVALCAYTAAWCIGSSIQNTLFLALVGVVFKEDLALAFSNVMVWESFGCIMIFAWSNWLCMYIKLYLIIALLSVAIITYVVLEIILDVDRQRSFRVET